MLRKYPSERNSSIAILFCTTCIAASSAYRCYLAEDHIAGIKNFLILFFFGVIVTAEFFCCMVQRKKRLEKPAENTADIRRSRIMTRVVFNIIYTVSIAIAGYLYSKLVYTGAGVNADFPALPRYCLLSGLALLLIVAATLLFGFLKEKGT